MSQVTISPPANSLTEPASTRRQRATLLVGSMAGFMIGLDATVVTTALPTIHSSLHASIATLGWTVSAYSLAFAALVLTGTALGEKFGRRRVFLVGLAVFTAASAAAAVSQSAGWLIAARAVQGAGGGVATPLSLVLITQAFPVARRGAVVGTWGAFSGIAVACGPIAGGAIVQGLAWQWVFWLNVPIGLALVGIGRFALAESRGAAKRLDPLGLVLASGAVFAVTDALLRGPQAGWRSTSELALFGVSAALVAGFVVAERTAREPMLPLRMFANASLSGAIGSRFALFATVYGGAFLIPQYLQLAHGFSPLRTGICLLPFTAPLMVIARVSGRLADRYGERALIMIGFGLSATGFALLGLTSSASTEYLRLLGPLLLAGIGIATAVPAAVAASLRAVPAHQLGLASGIGSTFQNLGGVFGVATASAVLAAAGSYATPAAFVAGLRPALIALAVIAVAGAITSSAVGRGARVPSTTTTSTPATDTSATSTPAARTPVTTR